jgi:hypothetical protein
MATEVAICVTDSTYGNRPYPFTLYWIRLYRITPASAWFARRLRVQLPCRLWP